MRYLTFTLVMIIALFSCQTDGVNRVAGSEKSLEEVQATISQKPANLNSQIRPENTDVSPTDTVNVGQFEFEELVFDFGVVDEGEVVEHTYKFKNTGKVPLVISNAKGSCGCTVPVWPREPIAVGKEGEIKVSFNTRNKRNKQTKLVTLTANTYPNTTKLTIKGEVTPDPNATKPQPAQPQKEQPTKGGQ